MTPDLPPRRRLRKLDRRADDREELAELIVAEIYGLEHVGDEGDWFDAVLESTGTKYQVKSTTVERAKGATGRYRLWELQHRSLVGSDAAGTAWYVFVLFDPQGGIASIRRCRPSTVGAIVRSRGGWNEAGHEDRPGDRQLKLPYEEVLEA